ncbi:uncharacterized protein LOC129966277 [Argiope bruennichi]|uniref:uncharacterized protein LOC129966277 n=1 Tax=Argiope bruennichi TaxID=94029 RepID=UPI002494D7BF|nr:uncharacterized protein LOC129966277 [Argiope bruennichi]
MQKIFCTALLLIFFIPSRDFFLFPSFNNDEWISCFFHFVCGLNEYEEPFKILEEGSDQAKVLFAKCVHQVFGIEDPFSREMFETFGSFLCNHTKEERMKTSVYVNKLMLSEECTKREQAGKKIAIPNIFG